MRHDKNICDFVRKLFFHGTVSPSNFERVLSVFKSHISFASENTNKIKGCN